MRSSSRPRGSSTFLLAVLAAGVQAWTSGETRLELNGVNSTVLGSVRPGGWNDYYVDAEDEDVCRAEDGDAEIGEKQPGSSSSALAVVT